MIKILFKKYNLPIETVVFKEYKRLGLTKDEAWFLMELFEIVSSGKNIRKDIILKKTEFKENDVNLHLKSLLEKGFFKLELKKDSKGKERDSYTLDPTFSKLENLLKEDKEKELLVQNEKEISTVVESIEKMISKNISLKDIEIIKKWYLNDHFETDDILKSIEKVKKYPNPTIYKIEKELSFIKKDIKAVKIDPLKEEEVMKIFRAIKK